MITTAGNIKSESSWKAFLGFTLRVIIIHSLTYFLFGLIFSNVFRYGEVFKQEIIRDFMLPMDQHNVLLGPFMQPVRGLLFAIGLWPIRSLLIEKKHGWLILWGLLVTLGILSTPAAAPSSIEGVLYTKLPLWYHLMGLPEIALQTLVFSIWLLWWERQSMTSREKIVKKENPLVADVIKAVMAACFAFIGYAIAGLTLAFTANARAAQSGAESMDIAAAGMNFKMQFMFVIAFIVNTVAVYWIARRWQQNQIKLWMVFLVFWFLDALVPWLYQTFIFGGSNIPTALLLGLLPAAIISLCIRLNYRKSILQEGKPV